MEPITPGLLIPGRASGTVEKVGELDGELCPSRDSLGVACPWVRHVVLQHPTSVGKEEPCKRIACLQEPQPKGFVSADPLHPMGIIRGCQQRLGTAEADGEAVLWGSGCR